MALPLTLLAFGSVVVGCLGKDMMMMMTLGAYCLTVTCMSRVIEISMVQGDCP